jgi:hypothetical protein
MTPMRSASFLKGRGIKTVIPGKSHRRKRIRYDKEAYRRVERRDHHAHDNSTEIRDLCSRRRKKYTQRDGTDLIATHNASCGSSKRSKCNRW